MVEEAEEAGSGSDMNDDADEDEVHAHRLSREGEGNHSYWAGSESMYDNEWSLIS